MLTHLIQSRDNSLFLIDEPDIYLHSELQRQLLDLLRNLGPDILIATHSTEIVTESNSDEIVVIDKKKPRSKRIKDPSSLSEVFSILGSNINPILTQLAKTRRALFVEGKDFQILGRFARRLGSHRVGNRSDFAVVPIEGFSPEKMKNLKAGMEATLGVGVLSMLVLDRDFRASAECAAVTQHCRKFSDYVTIHDRKEIENYVLVPAAIDRAIERTLAKRTSKTSFKAPWAATKLAEFADSKKVYVQSRYLGQGRQFARVATPSRHENETHKEILAQVEHFWSDEALKIAAIPGKEALGFLNEQLQGEFSASVTAGAIIDAMLLHEVPPYIAALVASIEDFAARKPGAEPEE